MNVLLGVKRPLFVAFVLGCTVSLLTIRALTLRPVLPALVYCSLVVLIPMLALAAVYSRDRYNLPFPKVLDSFFNGFHPWLLWLLGLCAIGAFLSPAAKAGDWSVSIVWLLGGGTAGIAWSLAIDFWFFRSVLRR